MAPRRKTSDAAILSRKIVVRVVAHCERLVDALAATLDRRVLDPKEETMGAILELTSYAATPFGMVAIIVIAALAYFAARWVFSD